MCSIRGHCRLAATFAEIEASEGRIDVLVNNAGVIFFKPIEETSVEDWNRMQEVNLRHPFCAARRSRRA